MVFRAAKEGDHAARKVMDRMAHRMARVIGSISTLVNPELVVIAGAVAASAQTLIPAMEKQVPDFTFTPPHAWQHQLWEMALCPSARSATRWTT